jgi:hypothetical protein
MAAMPFSPASAPDAPVPGLTRRGLLGSSAAGLALLVAGCTSSSRNAGDPVTDRQAEAMAAQVRVQAELVAAYRAAVSADPALGSATATLADQAGQQLRRLQAAAPGAGRTASRSPAASSAAASSSAAPPAGQDPKTWLAGQVHAAADSHAAAAIAQVGARAALLGSIAAGLRGQAGQLT